jgi:3-oxoacyl-[acyl-carrier protein] reductase
MTQHATRATGSAGHGLLSGSSVLVTGAAGTGIGFATARRCAEEGARVAITGRDKDRVEAAADALAELVGQRPLPIRCDITVEADVQGMIETAAVGLDGIDVLVNNAAVGGMAPVVDMTDEQWDTVVDTTLKGTFRCTRAALRHMLPRGRGVIVNNASVVGWRSPAGMGHYSAAKAGVMALTRSSALEVASSGVRINAVAPTLVAHDELGSKMPPGAMEQLGAQQVLGRAAEPDEIANVIVFLASDLSSYLTGEVISVSAQHP